MKIRQSFVANSSSSSFAICNYSDETLTWGDFIKETYGIEDIEYMIDCEDMTLDDYIAKFDDKTIEPGIHIFGGYGWYPESEGLPMLPEGPGKTEHFMWTKEFLD